MIIFVCKTVMTYITVITCITCKKDIALMTRNKTFSTRTTQKVLDALDDLAGVLGTSKSDVFDRAVLTLLDNVQKADIGHGTSQLVEVSSEERERCRWPEQFDQIPKENSVIYVLTNTDTGHRYVGSTMKDAPSRVKSLLSEARRGHDRAIHRAIKKYGIENFTIEVIPQPIEDLSTMEALFIKELDTIENGYNNTIHTSNSDHYRTS